MVFRAVIILSVLSTVYSEVITLSCDELRQVVDGHNERRLRLAHGLVPDQPPAANMKMMVWDYELEQKATDWAAGQQFTHNPDKTITSGRFLVGENLHISGTNGSFLKLDIYKALDDWFNEHMGYDYGILTEKMFASPIPIGHYTQMAWANTEYVGCAASSFNRDGWLNYLLVCNYGPTGNYIGQAPYEIGKAKELTCGSGDCSKKYGDYC